MHIQRFQNNNINTAFSTGKDKCLLQQKPAFRGKVDKSVYDYLEKTKRKKLEEETEYANSEGRKLTKQDLKDVADYVEQHKKILEKKAESMRKDSVITIEKYYLSQYAYKYLFKIVDSKTKCSIAPVDIDGHGIDSWDLKYEPEKFDLNLNIFDCIETMDPQKTDAELMRSIDIYKEKHPEQDRQQPDPKVTKGNNRLLARFLKKLNPLRDD